MRLSLKPIIQQFKLAADPSGETTVSIRQARTGDVVALGNLFAEQTRIWDDAVVGTVKLQQKWNHEELKRERAYLTVVGLDLIDDDSGLPVFRFRDGKNGPELDMARIEFIRAWNLLPSDLTDEINTYILAVNPQWNPALAGE